MKALAILGIILGIVDIVHTSCDNNEIQKWELILYQIIALLFMIGFLIKT